MSHIPYTICRHGTYYYNRRVPKHAVDSYGNFIRYPLSSNPEVATISAGRLSDVLEKSWQSKHRVSVINIAAVLNSYKPRIIILSEVAAEYISLKNILSTTRVLSQMHLLRLVNDTYHILPQHMCPQMPQHMCPRPHQQYRQPLHPRLRPPCILPTTGISSKAAVQTAHATPPMAAAPSF